MTNEKQIQGFIREKFAYLLTGHGFIEDFVDIDDFYSEVRLKKNNWILSIVTSDHGTNISIKLIHPNKEYYSLYYYFKTLDSDYNRLTSRIKLVAPINYDTEFLNQNRALVYNIKYLAEFIKHNGQEILESNPTRLIEIFKMLKTKHEEVIEKISKRL